MAWTTPRTWVNSALVTGVQLNSSIRDNFNMTAPALVTTAGDMVYATGANALARLAAGTTSQWLTGGTVPAFADVYSILSSSTGITLVRETAIAGVSKTLIASGIANYSITIGLVVPSSGNNMLVNTVGLPPTGASQEIYTGGADSLLLSVSVGGAMSIIRAAGSKTYSVAFLVTYA